MSGKQPDEVVRHIFKVFSKTTHQCMEPNETCTKPAIQSHSIPNSNVLSRLSRDGHVVAPKVKISLHSPPEVMLNPVGKNKATTFTGLCSDHDNDIFRPIDIVVPDIENSMHLFLLAYRAVFREHHAVIQSAIRIQSTYSKRVESGVDPADESSDFGLLASSHLCNAYETYTYKRRFDVMYQKLNWTGLKHRIVVLDCQVPTVAVSSMFSMDNIDSDEVPRICLSVIPREGDVVVIFSCVPEDEFAMVDRIDRIMSSTGYYQKYLISKLILANCDNFVLSPDYFDALTEDRKEAIRLLCARMDIFNSDDYEDENLYLF